MTDLFTNERQPVILQALLTILNGRPGGFDGMLQRLRELGFQSHVDSWTGSGTNLSLTPEDVEQVLGMDAVQMIARQAQMPTPETRSTLAHLIPLLIDKLSPQGKWPDKEELHRSLTVLREQTPPKPH